jgi:hypothetical protein
MPPTPDSITIASKVFAIPQNHRLMGQKTGADNVDPRLFLLGLLKRPGSTDQSQL